MNGHYDFLKPLARLMRANWRFERAIWALNALIISIAIYALMQFSGIVTLIRFYYQDNLFMESLPAILSLALGALAATILKRHKKTDIFPLLGPELSEKARTAYDNRNVDSLPMQSLAEEIKLSLASIKSSQILDRRQLIGRALVAVVLFGIVMLLAEGEVIEPADLQSIIDLKDRAAEAFEDDEPEESVNSSENQNLSENIYGKPSLAILNENKMPLVLSPGTGAGSIARNTEPVERVFQQSQQGEAAAVPSELYIESLPPENREIIKRYFTIQSQSEN